MKVLVTGGNGFLGSVICEKLAKKHDALGWKVNGAGGNGGSMTLLMDSESVKKRRLIEDLKEINPLFQNIPIYLSRFGLRVWESI